VQISISARHGQLSAGTQEKIREKVEKIRRIWDRVSAIQVTVDLEREDAPEVELKVSAEHADVFVATGAGMNVFAALDGALHKVEQQVRKHKEKKITGHRGPGHKHAAGTTLEPDADAD
jgi:putative sigma-54 modulation protein